GAVAVLIGKIVARAADIGTWGRHVERAVVRPIATTTHSDAAPAWILLAQVLRELGPLVERDLDGRRERQKGRGAGRGRFATAGGREAKHRLANQVESAAELQAHERGGGRRRAFDVEDQNVLRDADDMVDRLAADGNEIEHTVAVGIFVDEDGAERET